MGQLPGTPEILAALTEAGWLLEQRAARVLTSKDLHPRSGWAYEDVDDPGVSRELDIWSFRRLLNDEDARVSVTMRLLVECKQSSLPYVAIGQQLPDWRFKENPTQHVLPVRSLPVRKEGPRTWSESAWEALGFRALAAEMGETTFRATQLTRLDRRGSGWTASNAGIFTSLVFPLAKALRASQKGITSRDYTPAPTRRDSYLDFALHFPVVLIGCPLYVVDASKEDPVVTQREWTTAMRELKSKNIDGTFEIDIVTESAFPDYVDEKIRFAEAVAAMVAVEPRKFTGEAWSIPTEPSGASAG